MSAALRFIRFLIPFAYGFLMLYAVVSGLTAPYRNWDMLGYIGSVTEWSESSPERIYADTMKAAKDGVPDWVYDQYAHNPLSSEPRSFTQQLPFYQVKPLYTAAIWLFHRTGLSLPSASWTVSALSFAALSILLFLWRPRYLPRDVWLLLILLYTFAWPLMLAGLLPKSLHFIAESWAWPIESLAHMSTPDALCTACLIGAASSVLFRSAFHWFCLLGLMAMLARPDAILPVAAFGTYFALLAPAPYRTHLKQTALFLLALGLVYLTVGHFTHSYGLAYTFMYSFIDKTPYPAETPQHLTWFDYWRVFQPSIINLFSYGRVLLVTVLSLAGLFAHYLRPAPGNRIWRDILLLIWATFALRFALFPSSDEHRYYYFYYLIILFASGELLAGALRRLARQSS
jgi:hypothetical protein